MMQPKTTGDTLSRLQKETEELKALLAEAREVGGELLNTLYDEGIGIMLDAAALQNVHQRIDAALAGKATKSLPKVGEVRAVSGGYGLMLVDKVERDDVRVRGHGPIQSKHWFHVSRLSEPVTAEVVLRERAEATARDVGCNCPDCWCRAY